MSRCAAFLIAILLGTGMPAPCEARTWTQAATGRTVEADLVEVRGSDVVIRLRNGRTATVPIASLSREDQTFLRDLSKPGNPTTGNSSENAAAGFWPTFLGPDRTGVSHESGLMKQWPPEGPPRLWVFEEAGMGYSGFAIASGKLFTMGTKRRNIHMICLDVATGKEVWSKSFTRDDEGAYNVNWGNGPRGTPTWDDGKLYGLCPNGILVCLNAEDGSKLWEKDLVSDFDGQPSGWGYSDSPLVDGNHVIVAPGGFRAGIVALDKNDGKRVWAAEEVQPGKAEYSSIISARINGKKQFIKLFETAVYAVDATTGRLLWKAGFPNGKLAVVPTPVVSGNQIYLSAGYNAGCMALQIGPENSVKELWSNDTISNHHGGVIKVGDHLFGFDDGKGLVCQDWKSGRTVWMEKDRRDLAKGAVHVSDGMIYCLNEQNGAITLVEATPRGFTQRGRFTLEPQSRDRHPQGRV